MRILLLGASGRLGTEVTKVCLEKGIEMIALTRDLLANSDAFGNLIEKGQCSLLDVSLPEGTAAVCSALLSSQPNALKMVDCMVVGTTGHSSAELQVLKQTSTLVPVSLVSNFSRGVFLFEEILKARTPNGTLIAELARNLGFDLAMWESHHSKKLDSPSGTAKTLAQAANIDSNRIASTRVGSVVGEHVLVASSDSEELRIGHIAHSRRLFALGAVELLSKMTRTPRLQPGYYDKSEFWGL